MGTSAKFQAIPEDCELLQRARKDAEIAEMMAFFEMYAKREVNPRKRPDPVEQYFYDKVKELLAFDPELSERSFYASGRTYDAIIYLLSPHRRTGEGLDDGLIGDAIWGVEVFCPNVGMTIAFVPKEKVKQIVAYLEQITFEQLHEHYDPSKMDEEGVYKMHASDGEERFQDIWAEFIGMRNVYCAAANHKEAVITSKI